MTTSNPITQLAPVRLTRAKLRRASEQVGPGRMKVIVLLACVLMLSSADLGTVGAVATELEHSLRISNTELGLIAAVSALAGAVGTVPIGVLTDRMNRINLLSGSLLLWSAAMLASALAPSYPVLVLTRVALGAVTATSGPTLASLTGDYFAARHRAKVWGMILTGELLGSGLGLVVSGSLGGLFSWRFGFAWLALPGLALAIALKKWVPEPPRGTQAVDSLPEEDSEPVPEQDSGQEMAQDVIRDQGHDPHPELVLHEDPVQMPIWTSVRYVLRIRTNVIIILASALAYLFFAGVRTFAVELMRSRYHLPQATAALTLVLIGLGALIGVIGAGRIADRLLRSGWPAARVRVGAIGYIAAACVFVPALLSSVLVFSVPLFVLAAAALAAPDPTLNAARLDIMHPRLWGRAEGVRTVLYMLAFAVAPLLFGFISQLLGGPGAAGGANATTTANGTALAWTFLIMLMPLLVAGLCLLRARRSYPRDVATALASMETTAAGRKGG